MATAAPVTPAPTQPVVVTLPAEIDTSNAGQVRQQLYAALAAGTAVVVADMTATRFCDSSGLGALLQAHRQAAANSAELRLAVASYGVLRIMAITRMDTVLRIYPSVEEALAGGTG